MFQMEVRCLPRRTENCYLGVSGLQNMGLKKEKPGKYRFGHEMAVLFVETN